MKDHQRFEAVMLEYCANQSQRAYNLVEDGEDTALDFLAHLTDVLQFLSESQNTHWININAFTKRVLDLNEFEKDQIFTYMQETGFGQHIPE